MNKDNTSANRRSSIVTPAMRKAEEERKLRARNMANAAPPSSARNAPSANYRQPVTSSPTSGRTNAQPRSSQRPRSAPIQSSKAAQNNFTRSNAGTASTNGTYMQERPVQQNRGQTMQNTSVYGKAQAGQAKAPANNASAKLAYERQQQMAERKRQIEMLERQLKEENERRAATAARYRRIRDLEYRIDQERFTRNRLMAKEMKKDSPESIRLRSITAVAIAAILIIINVIAFSGITKKDVPSKNSAPVTENIQNGISGENTPSSSDNASVLPELESTRDKFTVTSSDYVNGTLVLVNSEHRYNFENGGTDITDDTLVTVATNIKDKAAFKASNYKILLNRETMDMLNLMMSDFYAYCGKTDVMVNTAHRTYEQQQEIFEAKKEQLGDDQKIAQTPGSSEHHTGYAFDLAIYPANENGSTFIKAGDYTWIYENCHKYGFILRYPEGKTAITGIDPESWHFRYVGVPHATYMYNKGKTLEEYITDISIYSESIPLTISVSDNETYSVFYVKKGDEAKVTFSVPKDTEYKISGDNAGGFIVWYNNADIGNRGKVVPSEDTTTDNAENGSEVSDDTVPETTSAQSSDA